ncbi:MAG: hypothetical protein ACOH1R_09880 [Luteimonas sp.]
MDVLHFFSDRTRFIRDYYTQAAQPFAEILRKIDAREPPYVPPYSEDGEPPFLTEWLEAQEMLEITGRCGLAMLSSTLQLYFKAWEFGFGAQKCSVAFKREFKSGGWVQGYRACLGARAGVDWSQCPANLAVLEQVVLARNRDQHPEDLLSWDVTHAPEDRKRHPKLFFLSDQEAAFLYPTDPSASPFFPPHLHVSRAKLFEAITQAERMCVWLEPQFLVAKRAPRATSR